MRACFSNPVKGDTLESMYNDQLKLGLRLLQPVKDSVGSIFKLLHRVNNNNMRFLHIALSSVANTERSFILQENVH